MLNALLNLLLPPTCLLCGNDSKKGQFCQVCMDKVKLITGPICTCCGKPFISQECEDHLCGECIKNSEKVYFSKARSICIYKGILHDAIHQFKYSGKTSMAKPLIEIISIARNVNGMSWLRDSGHDLIVPVPLHKTKLKERGFNQSLLLAKGFAGMFNLPIDYINLKRIRATHPQVSLKGKDRINNVSGAFAVIEKSVFKDKDVLLVDDVYTTGATVRECSKILKMAGARSIDVVTLARVADL